MIRGSPRPAPFRTTSQQHFFRLIGRFCFDFLLKGSSGYERPASSVEYNQLSLTPVIQSSTQLYQTGHVQTSHVENKKKIDSNYLGLKILCHV